MEIYDFSLTLLKLSGKIIAILLPTR